MQSDILDLILDLKAGRQAFVYLRSLTDARELVIAESTRLGALELAEGLDTALSELRGRDASITLDQSDEAGVKTSVFIQSFVPPRRMVVVGAVHIAQALAPMAKLAGFDVTIIDPRPPFAHPERFEGFELHNAWPDEILSAESFDEQSALCLLSHDPKIDDPALLLAFASARPPAYIGALGSRKTQASRRERLVSKGLTPEQVDQICGPIGLDIGAKSPSEIAVAILAQVIQAFQKSPS